MKKIFILAFLSFFTTLTFAQKKDSIPSSTIQNKVIIPEGTLVKVALKNEISSEDVKVGDQVEFYLSEPIIVGNYVVVKRGARILGKITEERSRGVLGKKGKLAFSIDYLYLDNGQIIKLRGQNAQNVKGSGVAVAATTVLLSPLGLLIPGKKAIFKAGTQFDAYIAETTELK